MDKIRYSAADPTIPRLYRGHAEEVYRLSSVWEREYLNDKSMSDFFARKGEVQPWSRDKYGQFLSGYLDRFKEIAVGIPSLNTSAMKTDLDWWALGRHHGLTTPILDWTRSPYIAAFFAVEETLRRFGVSASNPAPFQAAGHFVLWCLRLEKGLEVEDQFKVYTSRLDHAFRQKAQQGVFTYLTAPHQLEVDKYLMIRNLGNCLTKYTIPKKEWPKIVTDLHLMNIDYAALYPDLEGAALQANVFPPNYEVLAAIANGRIPTPSTAGVYKIDVVPLEKAKSFKNKHLEKPINVNEMPDVNPDAGNEI